MERVITTENTHRLYKRAPLKVDPSRSIAIKRDVHEFEVTTDATSFAAAFQGLVTDAEGLFGIIRVKRPAERMGHGFEEGERFQGCFSIERAVRNSSERTVFEGPIDRLLSLNLTGRLITWLEDAMLSDYAEVVSLEMAPDLSAGECYRLHYRYLDGTPIAGSSIYLVEPIGPERCRVTQIFEYQEINGIALATFQRFGLKMHDQVVAQQVLQAAERCGAEMVSCTIPAAYAEPKQ